VRARPSRRAAGEQQAGSGFPQVAGSPTARSDGAASPQQLVGLCRGAAGGPGPSVRVTPAFAHQMRRRRASWAASPSSASAWRPCSPPTTSAGSTRSRSARGCAWAWRGAEHWDSAGAVVMLAGSPLLPLLAFLVMGCGANWGEG